MNSKQKQVNALYEKITKAPLVRELLKEALEKNSFQTASWLLKSFPHTLEQKNEKGNTFLHESILSGNKNAAAFLLDQGADPNALGEGEKPPLHMAIEKKLARGEEQTSLELTQLLIEKKAQVNLVYHGGNTPLLLAVTIEAVEHARHLIAVEANTNHERILAVNNPAFT